MRDILAKIKGTETIEVSLDTHSARVRMQPGFEFPEAEARDALDIEAYKLVSAEVVPATE